MDMEARKREEAGNRIEKLPSPLSPPARGMSRSQSCSSLVTISEHHVLESEPRPLMKRPQLNSDNRDEGAVSDRLSTGKLEDDESERKRDQSAGSRLNNPSLPKGKSPVRKRILTPEEVNQRADDFIAGFQNHMRMERQESYERYQERIERSA